MLWDRFVAPCRALALPLALIVCMAGGEVAASDGTDVASSSVKRLSGRFANGMTYYIVRLDTPEAKVSFNLVVRVGQLNDRANPQTAHVVEHIVITKLGGIESKGSLWLRVARFGGRDVNGGTGSFDTSYHVTMPGGDPAALGVGLDILTDWATPGQLSDEEIDRELKVVTEESRRAGVEGITPEQYQQQSWFAGHPLLDMSPMRFGDARATSASVRQLYRRYYVPANMAVVIAGDVDPEAVLRILSARIGALPAAAAPPKPIAVPAASLKGGHYRALPNGGSKETYLDISFKQRPAAPAQRAKMAAIAQILSRLATQGFANLAEREGAPLVSGSISRSSDFARQYHTDLVMARVSVRRGAASEALVEALRLIATLRRTGFAASDVRRAQAELLAAPPPQPEADGEAARWSEFFASGELPPTRADIRAELARLSVRDVNAALAAWLDPATRDIFIVHAARDAGRLPAPADIPTLIAKAEQAAPRER